MSIKILQKENKILRKISKDVPILDTKNKKIKKVLDDMNYALNNEYDGVAIAAPQIGISLRIFIVSGKIFDENFLYNGKTPKDDLSMNITKPNIVFINPIITKISKDRKLMDEGCLSVRPTYGRVRRATKATVQAYNEQGVKFTKKGVGLLAHIFQHEIDHLDGILFIDKAKDLHEVIPKKENKENSIEK